MTRTEIVPLVVLAIGCALYWAPFILALLGTE